MQSRWKFWAWSGWLLQMHFRLVLHLYLMVFASQNELFWATFPDCSIRWELRLPMWWESSAYFSICGVLVFSGMMSYHPSFVFSSSGGLMAFRFYSSGQFPTVSLVLVGVTSEIWHFMLLVMLWYGASVYLVAEKEYGSVVPSLVIAKAKLAPLKTVTLSGLELLSCLVSARLLTFVHDALRLEKGLRYYCWSDSMVALSWIKADPSRWKAFVANRVVEIQTFTSPDRWFHCSGLENPGDLLTRGFMAEELILSKVWLQGPKFLVERCSDEVDLFEPSAVLCSVMAEEAASPVLIAATPGENVFQVEIWGKLTKTLRVVAWVLRFFFQFQTQARRSETGWCVVWRNAACTTSSHSTGVAAGVCSGSECFAARPSGGQVFSFSLADSILWWWWFVESAGQIAIFCIATWWEAPYSHPQESFAVLLL